MWIEREGEGERERERGEERREERRSAVSHPEEKDGREHPRDQEDQQVIPGTYIHTHRQTDQVRPGRRESELEEGSDEVNE